jgi:CheY-like chemotaxis protein
MAFNILKKKKDDLKFSVLVICDDSAACASLSQALGEQGYIVNTAVTVAEAIQILDEAGLPDVMIGDFIKPEVDGKAFLEQARIRFGRSALPPMIFLMDSKEDELTAEAMGVHDLVPKPFEGEKLAQCVRQLIESRLPASD